MKRMIQFLGFVFRPLKLLFLLLNPLKLLLKPFSYLFLPILVASVILLTLYPTLLEDVFTRNVSKTAVSTIIANIKHIGKLKVLKLIDSDFTEFTSPDKGDNKKAKYTYQWKAKADITVDLDKSEVSEVITDGKKIITIRMKPPEIENIIYCPLNERYSRGEGDKGPLGWLQRNVEKYVAAEFESRIHRNDAIQRAQEQAEDLLNSLFLPLQNDDQVIIRIEWIKESKDTRIG